MCSCLNHDYICTTFKWFVHKLIREEFKMYMYVCLDVEDIVHPNVQLALHMRLQAWSLKPAVLALSV
jgi:hypothetical protein